MSSSSKKIVGIIGGMGPECTAELLMRIPELTPVEREQDHLHVVIDSNPEIPDRIPAGTGPGELVGILATTGTIRMRLYEKALAAAGRKALVPDDEDQERVMECVYGRRGVKLGYVSENRRRLEEVWTRLAERGAATAIAGCTEVMLPFREDCPSLLVDPISVLAGRIVQLAETVESS